MKIKIVYGPPCSGKAAYAREHAGTNSWIFDYNETISACFNFLGGLTYFIRTMSSWGNVGTCKSIIEKAFKNNVDTFWLICEWPDDDVKTITKDFETEEILMNVTKKECYEKLKNASWIIDKENWPAVIDEWFVRHRKAGTQND